MKNKIYQYCLILGFCTIGLSMHAHQSNISSTMLIEKENGKWLLQIRSALTAFQYEVKAHYGEDSYDSPEAFQKLVLEHILKNTSLIFNHTETAKFINGYVKLGHESSVVFNVENIPTNIRHIEVKNESFKDISRNQSALIILKKGVSKEQFQLNEDNQHKANLVVEESSIKLESLNRNKSSSQVLKFSSLGILLMMTAAGTYRYLLPSLFVKFERSGF